MPMPIRPSNSLDGGLNSFFPVNMDLLQTDLFMHSSLNKKALANDGEADILFNIWKNSSVINNEEEIDKKIYRIKENVNKNDLLKLKASGLITGNDKEIRFTNRAANIIKTMVLGEPNSFGKQSVKKPYSIILAEQLKPKRKSALALASINIDFQDYDMLKISQVSPSPRDKYYYNARVISRGVKSPSSNKEYNVRVYESGDGRYALWTFWGRTNGSMRVERIGHYDMLENAKSAARSIIDGKENGDSRYRPAEQLGISPVNISIPGVPSDDSRSTRPSPTTPKISPKNVPKTAPSPEKEIHYEELSEEDKEKTLTKWLDEIQSGNTNHVVDCLKIKNPPKKILERLIKGDDVPFISNFPSTSRRLWIERILEDPDLNLDALEIISRVGIKENRFDGNDVWLLRTNDKIEQKILDMATGSNDWALDFLKQHPPADINFIINPELRQKYYEYEYNKNKRIFNRPVSEPSTQTKKSPEMEMAEMKKRLREELAKEENE